MPGDRANATSESGLVMDNSSNVLNSKILIVDDQEANVELLLAILTGSGYTSVSSTTDSREVCELHRSHGYDLIVLDMNMPHMDGFDVMEALKPIETEGYLSVLVVTADPSHKLRALQAGAKDFVSKPFDQLEVLTRIRNMLEVRLLHKELRAYNDELEAANHELDAFSYSVSHDLRAPLRAIDGYTTMLVEDYSPQMPAEARRLLDTVAQGAQRMSQLIESLLRLSHLGRQPLSKQNVDLAALVGEVVNELRPEEATRRIEVRVGELPEIHADAGLLRQVLVNLLSNAFKFTRRTERAEVEVGCRREDGQNVYFVRDNGAGFNMDYVDKLFGVFQRLHRVEEFEGTGVGLSTVKRIVERHGGRIRAEGEVGKGATFYFTLPEGTKET